MQSRKRSFVGSLVVLSVLGTGAAAARPFVYVTQFTGNSVTVIDAATNAVVETIPVQAGPRDVALSPDGTRAYIANRYADSVSVIDTATNDVVTTIPGVQVPASIVVAPDGTRAYTGADVGSDDITVIDLVTNSVAGSILYGNLVNFGLDILPDGSRLYAAPFNGGSVFVIDTSTESVTGTLSLDPTNGQALDLIVTPDGTRAYVSRHVLGSGRVTVIDIATSSQIDEISVGAMPWGLAMGADGTRLYVASGAGTVSIIDTTTNEVIGEPITVGGAPHGLAVTPDGTRLYVTDEYGTVAVIDLATNSVVITLNLPGMPFGIAIRPGPAPTVATMAIDPANPMTVYAGTAGDGVYRTLDGGTTWVPANTGLTNLDITALVISTDGSVLYAGTRAGGVFKSTDGAASWTAVSNGLDPRIRSLEIAPGNGTTLYAGIDDGGGVYKTTDGGVTWTAVNDGLPAGTP